MLPFRNRRPTQFKVELQGGLGNQLFILAAGLSAASRFDLPLVVDTRSLSDPKEWDFAIAPIINELDYPIELLEGRRTIWERAIRVFRLKLQSGAYFTERGVGFDPKFNELKPTQVLHGYFQSPKYWSEYIASLMYIALNRVKDSLQISDSEEDLIHIHIRRGDYLSSSAFEVHGLASMEYFENAASLIQLANPAARFKIFSDSPELIPSEFLIRWHAELDISPNSTPLESLLRLSTGAGLVMSNSSFSWWAAWLINNKKSEAPIIAPRPWLKNGDSAHSLLLPKWISLGS